MHLYALALSMISIVLEIVVSHSALHECLVGFLIVISSWSVLRSVSGAIECERRRFFPPSTCPTVTCTGGPEPDTGTGLGDYVTFDLHLFEKREKSV